MLLDQKVEKDLHLSVSRSVSAGFPSTIVCEMLPTILQLISCKIPLGTEKNGYPLI